MERGKREEGREIGKEMEREMERGTVGEMWIGIFLGIY